MLHLHAQRSEILKDNSICKISPLACSRPIHTCISRQTEHVLTIPVPTDQTSANAPSLQSTLVLTDKPSSSSKSSYPHIYRPTNQAPSLQTVLSVFVLTDKPSTIAPYRPSTPVSIDIEALAHSCLFYSCIDRHPSSCSNPSLAKSPRVATTYPIALPRVNCKTMVANENHTDNVEIVGANLAPSIRESRLDSLLVDSGRLQSFQLLM
jgi:hypothetical protein